MKGQMCPKHVILGGILVSLAPTSEPLRRMGTSGLIITPAQSRAIAGRGAYGTASDHPS
jgi:hypothetical protein